MFGSYISPLVHLAAAPFLYIAFFFLRRWLERKGLSYWLALTYPAVASLLVIALRELFDPRGWKTALDIGMWFVGMGLSLWAVHRMGVLRKG